MGSQFVPFLIQPRLWGISVQANMGHKQFSLKYIVV